MTLYRAVSDSCTLLILVLASGVDAEPGLVTCSCARECKYCACPLRNSSKSNVKPLGFCNRWMKQFTVKFKSSYSSVVIVM